MLSESAKTVEPGLTPEARYLLGVSLSQFHSTDIGSSPTPKAKGQANQSTSLPLQEPSPVYEALTPLWQDFENKLADTGLKKRALRRPQRICFVGRFKTGKTRLINALVGADILPYDTDECTAQMVELAKDSRDGAARLTTSILDNASEERITLEQFNRCVNLTTMSGEERIELEATAFRRYLNHPLLETARLVDTPGFDGPNPETRKRAKRAREQALAQSELCVLVVSAGLSEDDLECARMVRDHGVSMVVVLNHSDKYDSEDLQDIRDQIVSDLDREINIRPQFFGCSALWQIGTEQQKTEIAAKRRFFDYEDESQWHEWGALVSRLSRRRRGVGRHVSLLTDIHNALKLAARLRDEYVQVRQAEFHFPIERARWERMMPLPLGPLVLEMSIKAAIGGTPLPWHLLRNFGITPDLVAPAAPDIAAKETSLIAMFSEVLKEAVQIGLDDDTSALFDSLAAEVSALVALARKYSWSSSDPISDLEACVQELEWFSRPPRANFSYSRALTDLRVRWECRPAAMDENCSRTRTRLAAALG